MELILFFSFECRWMRMMDNLSSENSLNKRGKRYDSIYILEMVVIFVLIGCSL